MIEIDYDVLFFGLVDLVCGGEIIMFGIVMCMINFGLMLEYGKFWGIGVVWELEGGLGFWLSLIYW